MIDMPYWMRKIYKFVLKDGRRIEELCVVFRNGYTYEPLWTTRKAWYDESIYTYSISVQEWIDKQQEEK